MKPRIVLPALIAAAIFLISGVASVRSADSLGLTAHEWGTFTSVAGADGMPVQWASYGAPSDLPCFVDRILFKGNLSALVRMETPVIYFYGSKETSVDVKVLFPDGKITEWYPKATVPNKVDSIEWKDVRILPDAAEDFPTGGASHYFAARETDAAPVQVGRQKEKFLFYRGVGSFPLPLSAKAQDDGRILLENIIDEPVGGLMLFSNRNGKVGYQMLKRFKGERSVDSTLAEGNLLELFANFERTLIANGLYPKEAHAMIETWRDSWFEEGVRLFYILPRPVVDAILPLNIQPAPSDVVRVFVGRMEIITPPIQEDVKQAIANNDRTTLMKYGRFLGPIAKTIGVQSKLVDSIAANAINQPLACAR